MDAGFLHSLIHELIGGAITYAAAFAAIRVHLYYLRRDVDRAHKRLDKLEGKT